MLNEVAFFCSTKYNSNIIKNYINKITILIYFKM